MSALSQFYGGARLPLAQGGGPINPSITIAEVLLVGGGGPAFSISGGTSGAVVISTAFAFTQGTTYTITIGGSATDSSIVGGNVNLIAIGGRFAQGCAGAYRLIDEYTTSYGFGSSGANYTGGGGATTAGYASPGGGAAGAGGSGIVSNISGTNTAYGGGGGGAGAPPSFFASPGGDGGGGAGNSFPGGLGPTFPGAGGAGTANTGGGGGGGNPGGAGGSGVCIIRYPTAYRAAPSTTSTTPTPAQTGYNVYRWNAGPGTITF